MPSDQARDLEQPLIEEPTNGKKRSTLLTVCPYILGRPLAPAAGNKANSKGGVLRSDYHPMCCQP